MMYMKLGHNNWDFDLLKTSFSQACIISAFSIMYTCNRDSEHNIWASEQLCHYNVECTQ